MAHLRIQQQLDDNLRRQTAFANTDSYKVNMTTHELDVEKSTQQDPMLAQFGHFMAPIR